MFGDPLLPKRPRKLVRASRRQKEHFEELREARSGSVSFLALSSVKRETLADYRERLRAFQAWALPHDLWQVDGYVLGRLLVEFWEELYFRGETAGEAEKLLSAVQLLIPLTKKGEEKEPSEWR